jgi:FkbM family methyltransferase
MIKLKEQHQAPNYISNLAYAEREWNAPTRNETFEYLKDKDIQTIVDLGANFGFFTDKCLQEFPDLKRIDAVEPDDTNFEILEYNLGNNSKVHLHHCGVYYGQEEVAVTGIGDNSPGGYMVKIVDKEHHGKYTDKLLTYEGKTFRVKPLEVLFKEAPDLIKMDIEGSEYNVLENSELLQKCPYLILEFHNHSSDYVRDFIYNWLPNFDVIAFTEEVYGDPSYWYVFLEKERN